MPHIKVQMLKGRTEEQKSNLAETLAKVLTETLNAAASHVSVSIEDYTAQEWQTVFKEEITDKPDTLRIAPQYNPKTLL